MNKLAARVAGLLAGVGVAASMAAGSALSQTPKQAVAAKPGEIVGMRRLTEGEYRRSIADAFGPEIKISGRFEPAVRRDGLIAIGNSQAAISSSGMEQYYSMAAGISAQVTDAAGRKKFLPCTPVSEKKADDACATQIFAKYGRLFYRRPLEAAELKAFVATARTAATSGNSFYVGVEEAMTTLLASPHYLFRVERASATPTANGQPVLDNFSRASRLSFLFWDAPPDEELLQAAENGELSTKEGLAVQVERLAGSARLSDGLNAFFDDMLQMELFRTQTKDATRFPKYSGVLADDSRQQTLRTILDLVMTKNGDYRDIFTTKDTFLTRTLAMVYKVPYTANTAWSAYKFDEESPRAGVLTQVSFLSLFSHPAQSSPTKRGVALNEIFLCQPIPMPPNDVDFSAVNGSGPDRKATARLRLDAHRNNPTCASCHRIMDPPGLTLEKFDALGQERETEDGAAIDISSDINGHIISGAKGLGQMIHDDPMATSCLVRNIYATGSGRAPETAAEHDMMDTLGKAFADGGYRVPAFLKAAAKSENFFFVPKPKAQPASSQKETRQ